MWMERPFEEEEVKGAIGLIKEIKPLAHTVFLSPSTRHVGRLSRMI